MRPVYPSGSSALHQFKTLARQVNQQLENGRFQAIPTPQKRRLSRLFRQLNTVFSSRRLRRILAGAAVILGLGGPAQAQTTPVFGSPVQNPFSLTPTDGIHNPELVDIDGDGDLDILTSGDGYGVIKYYENTGSSTAPSFAAVVNQPFGMDSTGYSYQSISAADLDGDGDFDILINDLPGNFLYFENSGTATAPAFGPFANNPFGLDSLISFPRTRFVDLDGDGDMDLLSCTYEGWEYLENTGSATAPAFAPAVSGPFGLTDTITDIAGGPAIGDLDQDGDFDVLVGKYYGGYIYYENVGTVSAPAFAVPQSNPFSLTSVGYLDAPVFGDLDGDGDLDILAGSYYSYGDFSYYENTTPVARTEAQSSGLLPLQVYPNPTMDYIHVRTHLAKAKGDAFLKVHDSHGKLVLETGFSVQGRFIDHELNVQTLPAGSYFIRLQVEGQVYRQPFIKQ